MLLSSLTNTIKQVVAIAAVTSIDLLVDVGIHCEGLGSFLISINISNRLRSDTADRKFWDGFTFRLCVHRKHSPSIIRYQHHTCGRLLLFCRCHMF